MSELVPDILEAQDKIKEGLKTSFDAGIQDAILAITDPFSAALIQLGDAAEVRIKDATLLGSDVNEVVRLNVLEMRGFIEQSFGNIPALTELFNFDPAPATQIQVAFENLQSLFSSLANNADALGLSLADIASSRASALDGLRQEFDDSISAQIQGIQDPLEAMLADVERVAQLRLSDAQLLGADLVAVEQLNALERQKAIDSFTQTVEQSGRDIEGFNNNILASILAITNPMEATLYDLERTAQQRLEDVTEIGGDIVAVERLNMLERARLVDDFNAGISSSVNKIENPIEAMLNDMAQVAQTRLNDADRKR